MMNTTVSIIRRPVKHARLRVRETRAVELVVPNDFTEKQVQAILDRKANWIDRQHEIFLKYQRNIPELAACEVPLFGYVYRFIQADDLGRKVIIDHGQKIIRSGQNLIQLEERERWYRLFARAYLAQRSKHLSESCKLPFGRLFVLSQRTRWGGCTTKQNISLNWRLILAPSYVIDYVIFHELVHTKLLKHNQRFWLHLSMLCPSYKKAIEWLRCNQADPIV